MHIKYLFQCLTDSTHSINARHLNFCAILSNPPSQVCPDFVYPLSSPFVGVNILKRISQPTKMKEMINALRYWGEKLGNSSSEHGLGSVYRGAFLALALATTGQ